MRLVDNDRWAGAFTVEANARYRFTIEALPDPFRSWLADLAKRVAAGQDVASELREGAAQVREAAGRATGRRRAPPWASGSRGSSRRRARPRRWRRRARRPWRR